MVKKLEQLNTCPEQHVVFDGFVNGDVLLSTGLVNAVDYITKIWSGEILSKERHVVLVGRRTDAVVLPDPANSGGDPPAKVNVATVSDIDALASHGKLVGGDTQDWMLFSRGAFDWDEIPDFIFREAVLGPLPCPLRICGRYVRAILSKNTRVCYNVMFVL
jgi:hypothetical protein